MIRESCNIYIICIVFIALAVHLVGCSQYKSTDNSKNRTAAIVKNDENNSMKDDNPIREKLECGISYGGMKSEWIKGAAKTLDGGVIMTGHSFSFSDAEGIAHMWVLRVDSKGDRKWSKHYEGELSIVSKRIASTSDGSFLVSGEFYTDIENVEDVFAKKNTILIKLDEKGGKVWEETFSPAKGTGAYSIIEANRNSYVAVGEKRNAEDEEDYFNAWLFKTNINGDLIWEKTFEEDINTGAIDIFQTEEGGFLIVGSKVYVEEDEDEATFFPWIFKTDEEGQIIWEKSYDKDSDMIVTKAIKMKDDGFLGLGMVLGETMFDSNSFIAKYDSFGNKEWEKIQANDEDGLATSVVQSSDGGYFLTMLLRSSRTRIIKLNSSGDEEWRKVYNSGSVSFALPDDAGGLFVGGETSYYKNRESDAYIMKLDSNGECVW